MIVDEPQALRLSVECPRIRLPEMQFRIVDHDHRNVGQVTLAPVPDLDADDVA
jgi:hypothetical protein